MITVALNGWDVDMELDTGASLSVISQATYNTSWSTKEALLIKNKTFYLHGWKSANCWYHQGQSDIQKPGEWTWAPCGARQWSKPYGAWLVEILQLNWSHIHQITQPPEKWCNIVDRHAEVFREELGRVNQVKARIHVDPQAQPRFYKPRNVPYALKGKVESELDRLRKSRSNWESANIWLGDTYSTCG